MAVALSHRVYKASSISLISTLAHTTTPADMRILVLLALVGAACAAALPEAPVPVTDTEEVAKAKAEFEVAYAAAAAAAAADEVPEVVVPEGAPAPVEFTEEVAAARADFQAAYDAAAARVEAAAARAEAISETPVGLLSTVGGSLSPFYTNALGIHAPMLAAPALAAGAPLTYSGLGFPGAFGLHGFYGPYGLPLQLAKAEETTSRASTAKSVLMVREKGIGFEVFEKVRVEEISKPLKTTERRNMRTRIASTSDARSFRTREARLSRRMYRAVTTVHDQHTYVDEHPSLSLHENFTQAMFKLGAAQRAWCLPQFSSTMRHSGIAAVRWSHLVYKASSIPLICTSARTTAADMKVLVLLALVGAACAAALPAEAPVPVTDTEEVAQAKAEFEVAYAAAAAAAAADEVPEVVVPEGAPAPVEYTEEVAAARADFQAAYDAAAARAKINPLLFPFGIHAPMLAAPAMAAEAPLTYSGLGFPGAFGLHGFYGPYGLPLQLAKAEVSSMRILQHDSTEGIMLKHRLGKQWFRGRGVGHSATMRHRDIGAGPTWWVYKARRNPFICTLARTTAADMKVLVLLALVGAACAAALPDEAPAPVEETAEVAAARAELQAAHDAAAAAAEAAPDTDLDGSISTYTGLLSTIDGRLSPLYTNTMPYGAFGMRAPLLAGAPLAYSGLGLPGAYGWHGLPLLKVAKELVSPSYWSYRVYKAGSNPLICALAHTNAADMKVLVLLALVGAACAAALPAEAPAPVAEPEAVEQAKLEAPVQVADTEEVVKAKAAFQAAYAAAAAAAAAGKKVSEVTYPEYTKEVAEARADFQATFDAAAAEEGPVPAYIDDTKEVADARADFQAIYSAAAARAEAAPVTVLDGRLSLYNNFLPTIDGRMSPLHPNTFGAYGIQAPVLARSPVFTGAKVIAGTPVAARAPLTYSLPSAFGPQSFPTPYGLPLQFAKAECEGVLTCTLQASRQAGPAEDVDAALSHEDDSWSGGFFLRDKTVKRGVFPSFSLSQLKRKSIRAVETVESKGTGEAKSAVGQRSSGSQWCSSDYVSSSKHWGSSKHGGMETVGAKVVGVERRHPAVDGGEETAVGGELTVQVGVRGGLSSSGSGVISSLEVSSGIGDLLGVFGIRGFGDFVSSSSSGGGRIGCLELSFGLHHFLSVSHGDWSLSRKGGGAGGAHQSKEYLETPTKNLMYIKPAATLLIRTSAHTTAADMKVLVLLALVGAACAAALPAEAPVPVTDTEEVVQAKAEFQAAYAAAAAAAAADEVPEASYPEYTKEIADARADFQAAYDAAAARAEAAPDTDLDGRLSTYTGMLSTIDGRMSPLYTNNFGAYGIHAPVLARAPVFTGANVIAGAPLAAGAPLTYSGLGFPGAFGHHGFYGHYGLPLQFA
ncbi:uncharacterized protein [Panulirus ornatus]|uniref:uncharacterized protein n=1 Tax=Panulirus ornatus TaxID=150431 RepID=UPI003A8586FC